MSIENLPERYQNLSYEMKTQLLRFYNNTVQFERTIGVIIPTIFAVIILVGIVGNALVVVVALGRQMRNSTNTLIIGLAISDLMFLCLCVPFTAIDYALPVWVFPSWTCSMINYFQHISAYFSVWTLTLMAADRFLAVCFPVDSMTLRNTTNTLVVMVFIYAIILASQIPVGLMHGIYEYEFIVEERSSCAIVSIARQNATARAYFLTFNIFGYVLPLGITCVLYYFMLKRLWHTPRPGSANSVTNVSVVDRVSTDQNSQRSGSTHYTASLRSRPETVRAKRKVTRLVLAVVVIWAVCWLPINVCFFFSGMAYPDTLVLQGGKIMVIVQIGSQVLAYMNSCLNPILYALMSENFRKGFLRILRLTAYRLSCGACGAAELKSRASRYELTAVPQNTTSNGCTSQSRRSVQPNTFQINPTENCQLLVTQDGCGTLLHPNHADKAMQNYL